MLLACPGPCGSGGGSMSPFSFTQVANGLSLDMLSFASIIMITCPFVLWISFSLLDRSSKIRLHGLGLSMFLYLRHIHCHWHEVIGPLISINAWGTQYEVITVIDVLCLPCIIISDHLPISDGSDPLVVLPCHGLPIHVRVPPGRYSLVQ